MLIEAAAQANSGGAADFTPCHEYRKPQRRDRRENANSTDFADNDDSRARIFKKVIPELQICTTAPPMPLWLFSDVSRAEPQS